MATILELISIATGFAGALFWFLSASGKVPQMLQYWDRAPATDPFYQSFFYSVQMNKIAAALTGVSVLAAAAAKLLERRTRVGTV